MILPRSTIAIQVAILTFIGAAAAQTGRSSPEESGLDQDAGVEGSAPPGWEEGAEAPGQYKCACSPLCDGQDHCNTRGRCYTRLDPSSNVVRGCLQDDFVSKCTTRQDTGQGGVRCCRGDLCNLKLTAASLKLAVNGEDAATQASRVSRSDSFSGQDVEILKTGGDHLSEMKVDAVPQQFRCTCDPLCDGKDHCYTIGRCYVTQHPGSDEIVRSCFKNEQQSNLNCRSRAGVGYFRCCRGDLCNKNLTAHSPLALGNDLAPHANGKLDEPEKGLLVAVAVAVCVAALLGAAVITLVVRRKCRVRQKELELRQQAASCKLLEADALWKEDFGDQMSSGSGRGQPHLVKQTVGKQVTMDKLIGSISNSFSDLTVKQSDSQTPEICSHSCKGRFGEVWRGKWRGEDVAVKTFSSREETSYKQESEIYNTILLRHDNILGFCAADTIGINSTTQHLLIMHYHRNGSLYDYLQSSDIDVEDMLILAHSAAAGLSHLHEEILEGGGRRVKPSIAHRDIKSKNILVKDNGQCCIGDLGHAIRNDNLEEAEVKTKPSAKSTTNLWCFKDSNTSENTDSLPSDSESKTASEPVKLLVGTKRYMAPEVLNGELNPAFFESFKRVDVYAFGLVLWEIAKRARPYADVYHPPFWDIVPHDPTLEDMKKVVVEEGQRPPIPNQWANDPLMCEIGQMMCECWSNQPSARLTILRVKKNLHRKLKMMGHGGGRGGKFTGGEKKLIHCTSSGSSSFLCKYSTEIGGREGGRGGLGGRGRYGFVVRGGGSSGGESSSGVSGVSGFSGGISETYSGRL